MPCRTAVRSGLCLPLGPHTAVTSASIIAAITCSPVPTASASSPSLQPSASSAHRDRDGLRHGEPARGSIVLVLFFTAVPLLSVSLAVARHLPHGRSRAGDRHLNFYETRDNLISNCRGSLQRSICEDGGGSHSTRD